MDLFPFLMASIVLSAFLGLPVAAMTVGIGGSTMLLLGAKLVAKISGTTVTPEPHD